MNTVIYNWTMCRKAKVLEHSVLNVITSSKISHQASGNYKEEGVEGCRSHRMNANKQCLSDITGLVYI